MVSPALATGLGHSHRADNCNGTWELDQTRTHDVVNQIVTLAGTPNWADPAYDRNGNMTTLPKPTSPTNTYTAKYDAWNRLVEVKEGMSVVATYAYDGLNRRTTKATGGVTRHYYYTSAWQVVEERVGASSNAERLFLWGVRYIDDLVLRERDTDANGSLDERLYAMQDANWNVVALANTSGDAQERYAYQAYGWPKVLTAAFADRASSNYDWETRYAGYRWEGDTGLMQVRHRYLQSELGRFASRDPIHYSGGDTNLYRYVGGTPTHFVDPAGLDWEWHHMLPQAERFLPYWENAKLNIHLAEYGWMLQIAQHRKDSRCPTCQEETIHPNWDRDWDRFFNRYTSRKPTRAQILRQLATMKKDYADLLSMGIHANDKSKGLEWDYWTWRLNKDAFERAINEARLARGGFKKVKLQVKIYRKVGKLCKVVGIITVSYDVVTGGVVSAAEEATRDLMWPFNEMAEEAVGPFGELYDAKVESGRLNRVRQRILFERGLIRGEVPKRPMW